MIALVFWIFISLMYGIVEATVYHNHVKKLNLSWVTNDRKLDEHIPYSFHRSLVLLAVFWGNWGWDMLFFFSGILMFPFFHDGAYYQMRKYLSRNRVYHKGFFNGKPFGSTAVLSLNFIERSTFLILGLVLVLIRYSIKA